MTVTFDESQIRDLLPWPVLVEALRSMFILGCEAPLRNHYDVAVPGGEAGALLLMPAWRSGEFLGVKVVNVFPGNAARGIQAVSGLYVLCEASTGKIVALFDGAELTARRTAASSALAASYLARRDARNLLVIGTGKICSNLVPAYCCVRPIERVSVFGRSREKSARFVRELASSGNPSVRFDIVTDLSRALTEADIVTSATLATEPIIHGRGLPQGIHIDLIGGFRPDMREADDEVIRRADAIFVDTRHGASTEAGDITQPIAAGILDACAIAAELRELCAGIHPGRTRDDEITVFKSVGAALEDLAAAVAVFESHASLQLASV